MATAGDALWRTSTGGWSKSRVRRRWGAATVPAVAALLLSVACETPPPAPPANPNEAAEVRANIDAGLALYDAGDYVLAAQRFRDAAIGARNCGSLPMERKATTAACASLLQARKLPEFSACTESLERLHRRERRSDPGLNTLLAMGAISGDRPIPPFRVPSAVHPVVRAAAKKE